MVERHDPEVLKKVFELLSLDNTQENRDQFEALMEPMVIFAERGKVYGDNWKFYGALNNLVRAATKVDRTMAIWWHDYADKYLASDSARELHKDALDDAFDAINYLTFFIRLVREGNITGDQPIRPAIVQASRMFDEGTRRYRMSDPS